MAISLHTVCTVCMHSNNGSKNGEGTAIADSTYTKEEKRADREHRYTVQYVCTRDSKTRIARWKANLAEIALFKAFQRHHHC